MIRGHLVPAFKQIFNITDGLKISMVTFKAIEQQKQLEDRMEVKNDYFSL